MYSWIINFKPKGWQFTAELHVRKYYNCLQICEILETENRGNLAKSSENLLFGQFFKNSIFPLIFFNEKSTVVANPCV